MTGLQTHQIAVVPGGRFDGRTLGDTALRTRTGTSVVAVVRDGAVHPSPRPDFPLVGGDLLVVVGTEEVSSRRQRLAPMGALRAGAALVARGEFSIVIAGLAVTAGAVQGDLAALATAYVLLMAIIGPVAARFAEPLARQMLRLRVRPQPQ